MCSLCRVKGGVGLRTSSRSLSMAPEENVGTTSVPWTSVVTNGAQLAARSSVMQAGQAMAHAVASLSSGTYQQQVKCHGEVREYVRRP